MTKNLNTIQWDLDRLYASPSDPAIEADMEEATGKVREFRKKYYGNIGSDRLNAETLKEAITEIEALQENSLKPYLYAQLLFSSDTEKDEYKELIHKTREFLSMLQNEILFFELEILAIPDKLFEKILADSALSNYGHYLKHVRIFKPHTLSEKEEQCINLKNLTGRHAFSQLFEEVTASFRYRLDIDGEEKEYTGEELLAMLHRPEAEVRELAFSTFLKRHGDNALVLSSVFNNTFLDHAQECSLRGYDDPMTATHLTNELSHETIEWMMEVSEKNYSLAQDYFRLKAKLLKMPKLKNSDVYAPVGEVDIQIPFDEAGQKVLKAFGNFSPEMGQIARGFFEESRIDSAVRSGKTGGAFCSGMTPGIPSYVLMNYTGNLRDVSTLAHELGHGIHFELSKKQTMVNYDAVLPMAETASVFGEMLLTRLFLDEEKDPKVRTAILCAKIEDIIATTFRQNVLTRFEFKAHMKRKEKLLAPRDLCELWWEENAKLYGDVVEMIEPYKWGWSYISHFVHARFYCYSYVFGELLVLSLFQKYCEEGEAFVPRYFDLLSSGGSESPPTLLSTMGIDVNDPSFWQKGYDLTKELIGELKNTL